MNACKTTSRAVTVILIVLAAGTLTPGHAAITARLEPSIAAPVPVGTPVTWTVDASESSPGPLLYRFQVRRLNGSFKLVRDFAPSNTLDWTTIDADGTYVVETSIRNQTTGETVYASAPYELTSRLQGTTPVISPTANPLVFLYSASPCPARASMRVYFWASDGLSPVQATEPRSCTPSSSMNFYLAGMTANTEYRVEHAITQNGEVRLGAVQTLTTGSLPVAFAGLPPVKQTVLQSSAMPERDSILLQGPLNRAPFATDLNGNVIWYTDQRYTFLTRPAAGGVFLGINNSGTTPADSVLRVFDLAGTTLQETNAAAVNLQLEALGKHPISVFHHEARRLPNGNILTLGTVEQVLSDVQGPGPVDVIGDMVIVLDSNLQVIWTWNAFDYLDVGRAAVLGETCSSTNACMSHFLAADGNDWTHANSVQETPDGNLLLSLRHQDWLVKIDFESGAGDGHIIWRLGKDGDFLFQSNDDYPWFSHQHDANFLANDSTLTLFDNGNTRKATADSSANSRGQVLVIDQANRTVRALLSQDLGVFSQAVGSAQRLPNGNYHFDAGYIDSSTAISFELNRAGQTVRAIEAGSAEYRTFRLADLYSGQN